jgi:hypothetical protein
LGKHEYIKHAGEIIRKDAQRRGNEHSQVELSVEIPPNVGPHPCFVVVIVQSPYLLRGPITSKATGPPRFSNDDRLPEVCP